MTARSELVGGVRAASAVLSIVVVLGGCGLDRASLSATTVDGESLDLLAGEAVAVVAVFVTPDCPISNRYVPEINRLRRVFAERSVDLYVAYPDPAFDAEQMRAHRLEYAIEAVALDDSAQRLARRAGVEVTPEAVVFDSEGVVRYRGRIDDWYVDFGRYRPEAGRHDLEGAVASLLAGRAVPEAGGPAVGCYIPPVTDA